ncbi:hypothetical protein [Streptomyces coffeae]|uniref:Secreted protein n=1 Tax=Streptomyces coffeae TaxID=621382 RepID=A0ABS1NPL6_9ACTN|nr:hypothetical protein [Streptomyces coffeae]MBL1102023.1 hypothetical protein [Streptomyces coffeae]
MGTKRSTGISLAVLALTFWAATSATAQAAAHPADLAAGSPSATTTPSVSRAASTPRAQASETVALGFNSTDWRYLQVPPATDQPWFFKRGFDDSDWPTGQEAFGSVRGGCSWNTTETVKTSWAPNTDILTRHWVHIPRDAQQVHISGTIDNDAQVFFNGSLVEAVNSGSCRPNAIDVVVPASDIECCNLLAIRGHDSGLATFLNVQVTYTT